MLGIDEDDARLMLLACAAHLVAARGVILPVRELALYGARLDLAVLLFFFRALDGDATKLCVYRDLAIALLDSWTASLAALAPLRPLAPLAVDRARHEFAKTLLP